MTSRGARAVWKLLDVGIVKPVGVVDFARCTPLYAPPEVVSRHAPGEKDKNVKVDPAHDIWALGVMVFECICNKPHGWCDISMDPIQMALGTQQYPWEGVKEQQPRAWQRSSLRSLAVQCVDRDPSKRPSAEQIVRGIKRMGMSTTWEMSGQGTVGQGTVGS
jgi:serine/threonine protein kinase